MKPHHIFAEYIEGSALSQFYDALKQPGTVRGALMPDAHTGYSLPIGSVVATEGVVYPAWVGFDIGCGLCAVPTSFKADEVKVHAREIFNQLYRDVPVGFAHHAKPLDWAYPGPVSEVVTHILADGGLRQLGTLGGGNHFIEIGEDESGTVWITLHSGSRGVGHKIATHYMKLASGSDKARDGHFGLSVTSPEGQAYLDDLRFGLEFALANRVAMAKSIEAAMARYVSGSADFKALINRNHNHAELNSEGLWVHRKGATHAEAGMLGVIPGSMRDGSFIVCGKGNPDSLCSSSHGAGRVMGRAEAKRTLNMETFKADMAARGIMARVEESTLDESAGAYKNIFEVMAQQADLVEVLHHVKPLINIKGGKGD